jgi:Leucine-rich repeat (LRR) protein
LVQVHESIGHLKRLDLLNLKNCTKLKYLPRSIFNLESLKTLDLSGCSAFEKLPEQLQSSLGLSMTNLKTTSFFGCSSLIELPNFSHTPHLESLELGNCISLVEVHESIGHLKRLVFLNLKNCTKLKYLPRSIFNLESLETLDLSGCSAFEKLPKQLQSSPGLSMINLKIASFCGCSSLIELPNFSHIPHLESLKLQGCRSLVEVHESIGHLKRLFSLNLESCEKLRNLPNSISNIESLKTLYLRKCINLENLPEQLGNMTALIILDVSFTAIKQLPPSFRLLRNLIRVSFSGCQCLIESPEFSQTSCIKDLTFENCTSLVKIHESIGHLKELRELDFSGCKKLRGLPISSTSNPESLESHILSNCSELDKLPEQWENMMALSKLVADGTAIGQMPLSLGLLSGRPISPKSSNRIGLLSISELCSLTELDLSSTICLKTGSPLNLNVYLCSKY